MKCLALGLLAVLTGCDYAKGQPEPSPCFSVTPDSGNSPSAAILVDACSGSTWLLVRTRISDKEEDGFTYSWMKLDRYDHRSPTLVNK